MRFVTFTLMVEILYSISPWPPAVPVAFSGLLTFSFPGERESKLNDRVP